MSADVTIRLATSDDLPALRALIEASVRGLSVGFLTPAQIEAELTYVITPDTQLIADGTWYVAVAPDGSLAGAGGWSRRKALHGGDAYKAANPGGDADALLDPATDPARIRAMFTHPSHARQGIGRRLFETARAAAKDAGFRSLVLTATLPGIPLYESLGFRVVRRYDDVHPDGTRVPVAEMTRGMDQVEHANAAGHPGRFELP